MKTRSRWGSLFVLLFAITPFILVSFQNCAPKAEETCFEASSTTNDCAAKKSASSASTGTNSGTTTTTTGTTTTASTGSSFGGNTSTGGTATTTSGTTTTTTTTTTGSTGSGTTGSTAPPPPPPPALRIVTQPIGGVLVEGSSFALSVSASGGSGVYSYSWSRNGVTINNSNSYVFYVQKITQLGSYQVRVTDTAGGSVDSVVANVQEGTQSCAAGNYYFPSTNSTQFNSTVRPEVELAPNFYYLPNNHPLISVYNLNAQSGSTLGNVFGFEQFPSLPAAGHGSNVNSGGCDLRCHNGKFLHLGGYCSYDDGSSSESGGAGD